MTEPQAFSARILALRTALGMSQLELANFLGVTPTQVSRWENTHAEPHALMQEGIFAKLEAKLADARKPK